MQPSLVTLPSHHSLRPSHMYANTHTHISLLMEYTLIQQTQRGEICTTWANQAQKPSKRRNGALKGYADTKKTSGSVLQGGYLTRSNLHFLEHFVETDINTQPVASSSLMLTVFLLTSHLYANQGAFANRNIHCQQHISTHQHILEAMMYVRSKFAINCVNQIQNK